jgi:hypothetical protein
MCTKPNPVGFLLALLLLAALPVVALAQDAKSQIKAEIGRLQQSLQEKPITDPDLASLRSSLNDALSGASQALDSGKLYVGLEKLLQAEDLFEGARVAVEKAEAVRSGYPAFEAEWKNVSQNVTEINSVTREKDWTNSPAALRALSETALGRSGPLLDGGRGFALASKPSDGLFYLGQAKGESNFAKFASSLPLTRLSEAFPLRSFLPELQKLQERTNAAFEPPRSVSLHDRFIALNSALKLAKELDAQKFYAGALYQYLEATRHFGMLDARPVEARHQSSLRSAIAEVQKRWAASKRDDSIVQLFCERAVAQLAHDDGSAPTPDEWRSARVIFELVLPAYRAVKQSALPAEQTTAKTVQLTLVRWPYT